jgi:nitrogenase iron protein NifH
MTQHIALNGKSGVGTTSLAANISAALTEAGFSVVLIGCGFDGDSASLLTGGIAVPAVLTLRDSHGELSASAALQPAFKGSHCIELAGKASGIRRTDDLIAALQEITRSGLIEQLAPDFAIYDITGPDLPTIASQVVLNRVFVVTTADIKALVAANDTFSFLEQYNNDRDTPLPMGGLILNSISSSFEEAFVNDFAYHANARTIGKVPRSLVVRQSELYGKTVIEAKPLSNQAYYYRRLANQIVDASGSLYSGNLPHSLSAERLRSWSLEWADRIYALENGLVSDGAAI